MKVREVWLIPNCPKAGKCGGQAYVRIVYKVIGVFVIYGRNVYSLKIDDRCAEPN